jgi:DNA-binding beta-propeller fold protein YncE
VRRLAIGTCAMFLAGMIASYARAQSSGAATSSPAAPSAKISKASLEAPRKSDLPGIAVKVGSQPYGVAFDGKNIWTANFADAPGSVTKIRARDGKVLSTYKVGHQPLGVTFDGENIWVADNFDNTVTKLRASDGKVLGNFSVKSPWWMTSDGENIWVPSYGEKGTVTKLRASDGKNLGTFPTGGTGGAMATAFDGVNVWVTNFSGQGNGTVSKLRGSDGTLLGVYTVGPNPLGVTFDGTYIWVANVGGASITKLQPSEGKVLDTFTVPPEPYSVISDGKHIWVTGALELTELQASDGAVVAKYPIENTTGIAFDGKNVWISETFHNLLHRM